MDLQPEDLIDRFRDHHKHPANLALHAIAGLFALNGLGHLLRGQVLRGMRHLSTAVGLVVAGHRIEGNEPFGLIRELREELGGE
jgi:hypothetical protein